MGITTRKLSVSGDRPIQFETISDIVVHHDNECKNRFAITVRV